LFFTSENAFIIVKSGYPDINKKLNISGKDLNENISYLLGLLLSDGWVEKSGRLCFYNTHTFLILNQFRPPF